MLRYEILNKHPRQFLALTGLTPGEFKRVLTEFAKAYETLYPAAKTLAGKARQRQPGGGRDSTLTNLEDKLLFVLVYQKTYPLPVVQGELFALSQPRTNYWIHHLLPVLQLALHQMGVMPERTGPQLARHEQQQHEAPELIIDGTERRRQRPKKPEKQALHYSGKKKAHSDKNIVVVQRASTCVAFLRKTYAGRVHDKKAADQEQIKYPRKAIVHKDTAFQGYEPPVQQTYQPKKNRVVAN